MKWVIPLSFFGTNLNLWLLLMTKCNVIVQVDRETIELLASLNMPQLPGVVQQVWTHCLQPYFPMAKFRGNISLCWCCSVSEWINATWYPCYFISFVLLSFLQLLSLEIKALFWPPGLLLKLVSILMLNVLLVKQAAPPAGGGFFKPQVGGFQGGNQGNRNRS